jgi:hypothetical protein
VVGDAVGPLVGAAAAGEVVGEEVGGAVGGTVRALINKGWDQTHPAVRMQTHRYQGTGVAAKLAPSCVHTCKPKPSLRSATFPTIAKRDVATTNSCPIPGLGVWLKGCSPRVFCPLK